MVFISCHAACGPAAVAAVFTMVLLCEKGDGLPIIVNLDVEMARKKMSLGQLAKLAGISQTNLSILKTGKAKAVRFSTLAAICKALQCQPGDILAYREENP